MPNTVIIAEDPLSPSEWKTHEGVGDVREFLKTQFDAFPDTARIYHNFVAESHDVTPGDEMGIERLGELTGKFYVIVYPGEPATIGYIIFAVVVAVAASVALTSTPSIPSPTERTVQSESPNNGLSDRQNKPRVNGRIPDIYGTVRSTPDLIALPYTVFEDDIEVEYTYMCVGVGEYDITPGSVKEGETPVSDIDLSRAEIYGPNTSPKSGTPQLAVGSSTILEELYSSIRSNSVNGQSLNAKGNTFTGTGTVEVNIGTVNGKPQLTAGIFFGGQDIVHEFSINDKVIISGLDHSYVGQFPAWATSTSYSVGDLVSKSGFIYKCTVAHTSSTLFGLDLANWNGPISNYADLSGTYFISHIAGTSTVFLREANAVNSDWDTFEAIGVDLTGKTATIEREEWIGPFEMAVENLEAVYCNVVAPNGLFVDDGTNQDALTVDFELELTPRGGAVNPGTPVTFSGSINGSHIDRRSRALTLKCDFGTQTANYGGSFLARMRRTTARFTQTGQIVDELKWRDLYAMEEVSETDFGNVTTVHLKSAATEAALQVKSRKLNLEVTRKIPARISGSTFGPVAATKRADEIISAICLDPRIGNRSVDEIDFDNIYDTVAEVEAYFGTAKAVEFSYTFDSDNLSFEETISSIANAIHCVAYRQGNQIKINFEKETDDSILLFNHRNKLPGTESRTVRFGPLNDNDGVEFEYVDPATDLLETIYIPSDKSAVNPKKVESIGIRDPLQAYFHSRRVYNKLQYQNLATEFEATQETALVTVNDRVLVADNTRPDIQDGEVLEQVGLELTLSQDVDLTVYPSYSVFLQHSDGSVESISITAGTSSNNIVLGQAPSQALVLDDENYARTTYLIVGNTEQAPNAFIISEKSPQGNFTSIVRAVNYDSRYYQNDKDFDDGIVDSEGNII